MDGSKYITAVAALLLVLSLIALISFFVKKYGQKILDIPQVNNSQKRIKIIELKNIDSGRKLVLFSLDEKEYLVMTANNNSGGNLLIESKVTAKNTNSVE